MHITYSIITQQSDISARAGSERIVYRSRCRRVELLLLRWLLLEYSLLLRKTLLLLEHDRLLLNRLLLVDICILDRQLLENLLPNDRLLLRLLLLVELLLREELLGLDRLLLVNHLFLNRLLLIRELLFRQSLLIGNAGLLNRLLLEHNLLPALNWELLKGDLLLLLIGLRKEMLGTLLKGVHGLARLLEAWLCDLLKILDRLLKGLGDLLISLSSLLE